MSAIYLDNTRGIVQRYATELMFANIRTGSETTQDDGGGSYSFPDVVYLSHKAEDFHVLGDCNVDTELDLVNSWVIDSNVIEDIAQNAYAATPITTYDDKIIIVETGLPGSDNCSQDSTTFSGVYVYNMGLTTRDLMINYWLNALPNDIAQYLGNGNDEFRAQLTATVSAAGVPRTIDQSGGSGPFQADDDSTPPNFDTNANYDAAGTLRYTFPATGYYVLNATILIRNFVPAYSGSVVTVTCTFYHKDSGGTPIITHTLAQIIADDATLEFQPPGFYANNTDYVYMDFTAIDTSTGVKLAEFDLNINSYIEMVQTSTGGGIFQTFDPENYPVLQYEFTRPLSIDDWKTWLSAPHRKFRFNPGSNVLEDIEGFIEKVVYTPQKQAAQITVISTNND